MLKIIFIIFFGIVMISNAKSQSNKVDTIREVKIIDSDNNDKKATKAIKYDMKREIEIEKVASKKKDAIIVKEDSLDINKNSKKKELPKK